MNIKKCIKMSFSVIGKEGSTDDGGGFENFVTDLWDDANSHFSEIKELAKKDAHGNPTGFWGAMSDMSRSFRTWENNFTKGLYLAGVEVDDDAAAPSGWVKWTIPSYEYLCVKVENGVSDTFPRMIEYLKENDFELVGAVHDYFCPEENGQRYKFFPIRTL